MLDRTDRGAPGETSQGLHSRLDELFAAQAKIDPQRPAVLYRGATTSYGTLDGLSNQIAHYLQKLGVTRGTLVALCMPRSPHMIAAMLGVLKAGGGYLPLDPAYPAERLNFMLADSAAPLVLVRGAMALSLECKGQVCDLEEVWSEIEQEPVHAVLSGATASDVAYVIYTSGSTGTPKGVVLAHSATALVRWLQESFDPRDIARVAACTSICFDPSIIEIFGTLCTGGLVVLKEHALEPFHHGEVPTMLAAPPSVLSELARMGAIPASVRVINVGGEAVTSGLVDKLYASSRVQRVYNHYGPTEATTCTTVALAERDAPDDPPIGRAIAGARVYVLGPSHELLPEGDAGEIYIAGPTLALGYLGDRQMTESRFMPDPFHGGERMYRTGDLGMFKPNGDLVFKGRIDDQVKLRGFRIELGEVEAALMRVADVQQAVALVHPDALGRGRLVAYVASDKQLLFEDVRRQLATWLPDHMLPSRLVSMDRLPLGLNGKVDRAALTEARPDAPQPITIDDRFATAEEEVIARILAQHLGLAEIGPEDDFYDLGGDSLLSIAVAVELEEVLGEAIPPIVLNQASTPRALAAALAAQRSDHRPSVLTQLGMPSDGHPIFCTPDLHGRPVSFVSLARRLAPQHAVIGLSPGPFTTELTAEPDLRKLSRVYFDAMRTLQPAGPYIVSGFSFGAIQAFSLARVIEEAGERVFLILIDGPNPAAPRSVEHLLRWGARELPKAIAGKGFKRNLKDLHRARPWTRLLRNSKQRVRLDEVPDFIREADRPFARSLLQAIFDYVPEPFGGTNLLVRCSDPDRRFTFLDADGLLGWRGLLTGTFHHACVEGTHMQMMREPRVGDVHAILGTAITSFLLSGNMKLEAEPVGDRPRRSRPNRSARAATV